MLYGRQRKWVLAGALFLALSSARRASAYIDPGTGQQVWSTLGPILGILIACFSAALFVCRTALFRSAAFVRKCLGTKRRILAVAGLLGVCALAVLALGTGHRASGGVVAPAKGQEVTYKRVIVIGMDGLDPRLVERMMVEGQLPNFARLAREGTFSTLQTTIPPESPVAWTTAATGVNPGRHGIYDFIRRDPKTYLPDLSILRSSSRSIWSRTGERFAPPSARKPFWDVLAEKGIPTTVIRWPVTFPARAAGGKLLSGLGTPDVTGSLGRYTFFTTLPPAAKDSAPERVVSVKWNGTTLDTELPGPEVVGLTGRKTSAVPLHVERIAGEERLSLRCGKGEPFALAPGKWSDFVSVSFPGGLSENCPAMVKFHLVEAAPELKLYATAPQVDPRNPAFPISFPKEYAAELAREIGPYATLGMPEDAQAVLHGRIPLAAYLDLCNAITREREAMFDRELGKFDRGLLAVVFDTSDRIQHMFWRDGPSGSTLAWGEPSSSPVIAEHYLRMDSVLGKALAKADAETAVFVLSDHGFTSFARAVHLNRWLIRNGYMRLKDSDDAEGQPLLGNVDWARTKAYAVGFNSLYLNLAGREGEGIVRPEDAPRLAAEIAQKLRAWNDEETGRPVIRNAYVGAEVYSGESTADAPDFIIGYHPGHRASWQTALGAAPAGAAVVANTESWNGDHLVDAPSVPGTFLSSVRCPTQSPALADIAPTVLKAFGVAAPAGLDGKALF